MVERPSLGNHLVIEFFNIRVQPGAKKNLVKEETGILKVYVTAQPVDDKANKAVIDVLADYFGVKKGQIEITKGLKSRNKTISIGKF
jgi:uncharacterized protein (TIGR00251 family)